MNGLVRYFRTNPQAFVLLVICLVLGLGTFIVVLIALATAGSTTTNGRAERRDRGPSAAGPLTDPDGYRPARSRSVAGELARTGDRQCAGRAATEPARRWGCQRNGRRCGWGRASSTGSPSTSSRRLSRLWKGLEGLWNICS